MCSSTVRAFSGAMQTASTRKHRVAVAVAVVRLREGDRQFGTRTPRPYSAFVGERPPGRKADVVVEVCEPYGIALLYLEAFGGTTPERPTSERACA